MEYTRQLLIIETFEVSVLLGYAAESQGNLWQTFRHILTLRTRKIRCFETSGAYHPVTRRRIPEGQRHQLYRCELPKTKESLLAKQQSCE
jgi:hypothetical protein